MNDEQPRTLTESEVARRLSVSVAALRKWRRESQGPRFMKLGRRLIRYSDVDLQAWLEAQAVEPRPRRDNRAS